MDSWDVCLSEDFDFQYDTHEYNNNNNIINKSKLIGSEFKPLLDNHTQEFERLDFKEIGFSDEISTDYNNVASSNDKGFSFSLVDLKLARFGDRGIGEEGTLSVANTLGSSIESSPRVKRSRSTRSCLESPRCQVQGCSKDLSSYKGYYKRNKVCNEHTRAARVIVSGMEQRFCQQCSRFHFLVEFDDGKRSCRKRLAEHNKRRRKPQFPSKSEALSEALSTTTLDSGKFEALKWAYHVKTEDSVAENMKDISCNAEGNIINTSTCRKLDSSIIRQNSRARALSLLSSYSGNGTATPLLNTSPDIFKDIAQKGFHEPATYSETDHEHPSMISSLHLPGDGTLRESDVRDTQSGRGIVLNLLELSSRLQTVEQQKQSTEREAV